MAAFRNQNKDENYWIWLIEKERKVRALDFGGLTLKALLELGKNCGPMLNFVFRIF